MSNHNDQRGEGKIGCIVSLAVVAILVAAAFQVVPVLFSNNDFLSSVENIAGRAAIIPQATIEAQIRQKARELEIPEATTAGAVTVTKTGEGTGTCTVRIRYTRKIDFYGIYTYPLETNVTKSIPYMDAR